MSLLTNAFSFTLVLGWAAAWWMHLAITKGHSFFGVRVNAKWARLAADTNAKQLLSACDVLYGEADG